MDHRSADIQTLSTALSAVHYVGYLSGLRIGYMYRAMVDYTDGLTIYVFLDTLGSLQLTLKTWLSLHPSLLLQNCYTNMPKIVDIVPSTQAMETSRGHIRRPSKKVQALLGDVPMFE